MLERICSCGRYFEDHVSVEDSSNCSGSVCVKCKRRNNTPGDLCVNCWSMKNWKSTKSYKNQGRRMRNRGATNIAMH